MPPQWSDYVVFFATNYLAHAFTLVTRPGQHPIETIVSALNALFVPSSGALYALRGLFLRAGPRGNELERAARAGALCTVMKKSNMFPIRYPEGPDSWRIHVFGECSRMKALPAARTVHGRCEIPKLYRLVELPFNVPLRQHPYTPGVNTGWQGKQQQLAYTYNIPKVLVGLCQAIWGAITLYRSRGDQIDRYGIAAFGLSVAPYGECS